MKWTKESIDSPYRAIFYGEIMVKKVDNNIRYVFLNEAFYRENKHFVNMLDPNDIRKQQKRPYVFLEVEIKKITFLIPLRTNLTHPYGFRVPSTQKKNAGLDFTKMIIYPEQKYIKSSNRHLFLEQHKCIKQNIDKIKKNAKKYIKDFIRDYRHGYVKDNRKYMYTTLFNYVDELVEYRKIKSREIESRETDEIVFVHNNKEEYKRRQAAYLRSQGYER